MRRWLVAILALMVVWVAGSSASATTRYRAMRYRYANAQWCPQDWHSTYGAKRLIRCEALLYGVSVDKALDVAYRESSYHWWASNSCCHGLFQQHESYWAERYAAYAPHRFHYNIFGGRTNTVVSVKMARAGGWGPWGG